MKVVTKPWGREVWVAHTDKYALKIIELEKGTRSSLQYHPKSKIARKSWTWYAYGIVSIDGNLYQFISHTGVKGGSFTDVVSRLLLMVPKMAVFVTPNVNAL